MVELEFVKFILMEVCPRAGFLLPEKWTGFFDNNRYYDIYWSSMDFEFPFFIGFNRMELISTQSLHFP